tara:strand:+ start:567 stop:797 length:231 start_codon:yes stop_codon:yes gene_type:complete
MIGINHVIHLTTDVDFNIYVYTQVYAGTNASPTINGDVVDMFAGTTFDILVKTISSTPNVYLLGKKRLFNPMFINQ